MAGRVAGRGGVSGGGEPPNPPARSAGGRAGRRELGGLYSCTNSVSTPLQLSGWMKAMRQPWVPVRGSVSMRRTPAAARLFEGGVEVGDGVGDVVHAVAAFGVEAGDGAVGVGRLDEFDPAGAGGEGDGDDVLVGDVPALAGRQSPALRSGRRPRRGRRRRCRRGAGARARRRDRAATRVDGSRSRLPFTWIGWIRKGRTPVSALCADSGCRSSPGISPGRSPASRLDPGRGSRYPRARRRPLSS